MEEEGEVEQSFQSNGEKELHETRSKQGDFRLGEGGAARKKKEPDKNGLPLLYIAQEVRASGSTAGVLAVVPLPLAVVPLPLETLEIF